MSAACHLSKLQVPVRLARVEGWQEPPFSIPTINEQEGGTRSKKCGLSWTLGEGDESERCARRSSPSP